MLLKVYHWWLRQRWVGLAIFAASMLYGGYGLANELAAAQQPISAPVTRVVTLHNRIVVRKVVRGRVVRLASGVRVVRVPLVVIHADACNPTRNPRCVHRIVVPAHTIRLREATLHSAVVTAAVMPVTVTVYVPTTITQTVTTPAVTVTQTDTTTDIQTLTVTVTVPINPEGSQ